jgi:hypothetical protein
MAHFAEIQNGVVVNVIVIDQETLNLGHWGDPANFKQTSYNTRGGVHYGADGQPDGGVALRGNYAGIGYVYDAQNDVFHAPRPKDSKGVSCDSFTIGAPTWTWVNPVAMPSDAGTGTPPKLYDWDEATKTWEVVTPKE